MVLDPVIRKHRELEQIALASLKAARLLMECGARAEIVHEGSAMIANGLGAEHVELRSGYASLAITVSSGINTITRMSEVGPLGVNYRLDHAVQALARRVRQESPTPAAVTEELARLEKTTPRHSPWLVALAVGIACASFGRLFGIDWAAVLPVVCASALGQMTRYRLHLSKANPFVTAAIVACQASGIGGLLAHWAGSATVNAAMTASVLLLVPGVPALNAQSDIMEGRPTLGSARAMSVVMLLIFTATGVLVAQTILGIRQ